MIRTRAALLSAAMISLGLGACVMEPMDGELTDEDIAMEEQEVTYTRTYQIGSGGHQKFFVGYSNVTVQECTQFDDGVIRGWHASERNIYDFRYSRHFCRDMLSNGTLGSTSDRMDHFYHEGDGTTGSTSVPLDSLPVGVRIRYKYFGISDSAYKISDMALLYDQAADIAAGYTGYQAASYAFGHSDSTATIVCDPGYVMTGLGLREDRYAGGSNQSEIEDVRIQCRNLEVAWVASP